MEQFILSICIPTYNRAVKIEECVKKILSFNIPEVECVVSDDCSKDETCEVMQKYSDLPNFIYHRNENNLGWPNSYMALTVGRGKYSFLMSDEDDICEEGLRRVIEVLKKEEDQGVVLTNYIYPEEIMHFYKGNNAFCELADYMAQYMTGIIFNRNELLKVKERIDWNSYFWNVYPHQYLGFLILDHADGLIISERTALLDVRVNEEQAKIEREKRKYNQIYHPNNIYKTFESQLELVIKCSRSKKESCRLAIAMVKKYTLYILPAYLNYPEEIKDYTDGNGRVNYIKLANDTRQRLTKSAEARLLDGKKLFGESLKDPKTFVKYLKMRVKIFKKAKGMG